MRRGKLERAYEFQEAHRHNPSFMVIEVERDEAGKPLWCQHHRFRSPGEARTFIVKNADSLAPGFVNKLPKP